MFVEYFEDWEVKREFVKEFVSIFDGWLGVEKLHELDVVTENEWKKFNALIKQISNRYEVCVVNFESKTCSTVSNVDSILDTYIESMDKEGSQFTSLVIPALNCVLAEHWDYTYIIWHKNNGAIDALKPLIRAAGLYSFRDAKD
jgi:hypothetical protein